jgi:hypothetical protein
MQKKKSLWPERQDPGEELGWIRIDMGPHPLFDNTKLS